MNLELVREVILRLEDKTLIKICEEIEKWNNTGILNQDGKLKELYNQYQKDVVMMDMLKDMILFEAQNRYNTLVKVLLKDKPNFYIK